MDFTTVTPEVVMEVQDKLNSRPRKCLDYLTPNDIFRPSPIMKIKTLTFLLLALGVFASASCIPLAVGAAAGYVAHDEGYRVQNPIKKTGD